jgi:hypothetical protein
MDDFEYLDDCARKCERLPAKKLTRQQQAVVDVVGANHEPAEEPSPARGSE